MASGKLEGSFPMELNPLHDLERLILDLANTIFYSCNPYGGAQPVQPGCTGPCHPLCPRGTTAMPTPPDRLPATLQLTRATRM